MVLQCMRVMEGQSTVNYANSTNCVLTLVSFVCGSIAKAYLGFFCLFVFCVYACYRWSKQEPANKLSLHPPSPRPRHKLTHTESHLRQHSTASTLNTQLLCYLTFPRHSSHTAFHPEVDKATKNSRAVLFSFLWPFLSSPTRLPLAVSLSARLSLTPNICFFPSSLPPSVWPSLPHSFFPVLACQTIIEK